jgi:hypothetical protein
VLRLDRIFRRHQKSGAPSPFKTQSRRPNLLDTVPILLPPLRDAPRLHGSFLIVLGVRPFAFHCVCEWKEQRTLNRFLRIRYSQRIKVCESKFTGTKVSPQLWHPKQASGGMFHRSSVLWHNGSETESRTLWLLGGAALVSILSLAVSLLAAGREEGPCRR